MGIIRFFEKVRKTLFSFCVFKTFHSIALNGETKITISMGKLILFRFEEIEEEEGVSIIRRSLIFANDFTYTLCLKR